MSYLSYALQLVTRNPRRTGTYLFGLVLAVGLFSGILFFIDASSRRMTQAAVQSVKVDMQVYSTLATPALEPVLAAIRQTPGVIGAQPLLKTDFGGAATAVGDKIAAGGNLFVLAPDYFSELKTVRLAAGAFDPQSALVSQQLFAALGLKIGDAIAVDFPQMAQPVKFPVSGVVDTTQANSLFVSIDPAHAGEFNPIPNDIFIAPSLWKSALEGPLSNPSLTINGKKVAAASIRGEVDARIDHTQLPNDPLQASRVIDAIGQRLVGQFPGEITVANNLGDALAAAKSDALWAKLLFLFLGMPGVALAAYLAKYATELISGPQRQEISLLRARGATPRQILTAMGIASLLVAAVGTLGGLVLGAATTLYLFGPTAWQQANIGDFLLSAIYTLLAGLALTTAATYLPIRATLRQEIAQERQGMTRSGRRPFWMRAYLDLISLAVAALLFTVNARGGGFDTGGGEARTLSFGFIIFLAPLFLWIGATLLLARVMAGGIRRSGIIIRAGLRAAFGDLGDLAGRQIVRRAGEVGAAVVIIALAISFGTSLAIFTNTYHAQTAVDARYELGADIQITPAVSADPTAALAEKIAAVPGVGTVTPVRIEQAYVGATLETVYGVDTRSLEQSTYFPDSYVLNMTAPQALEKLAAAPDGVLLSSQLASAYSVHVGDPVIFRVLDRETNQYIQMKGTTVGIMTYFPASTTDTFLVVNMPFLTQSTNKATVTLFFARAASSPAAAAKNIGAAFPDIPMQIQDVDTAIIATGSTLTSLNINGLGAIEGLYMLIIASVGLGVFLMALVYQRAREFGALRAIGGDAGQVSRFLWAESLTIGLLALVIGTAVGFSLSKVFLLLLGALFTITPADVSVPWPALLSLYALTIAGMIISTVWVNHRLNHLEVDQVLREV